MCHDQFGWWAEAGSPGEIEGLRGFGGELSGIVNRCPPACGCPPGTHGRVDAVTARPEQGDVSCAACPSVILAGAPRVYETPDGFPRHPGCEASKQWHVKHGQRFPPLRGQNDGKALDRAARETVTVAGVEVQVNPNLPPGADQFHTWPEPQA